MFSVTLTLVKVTESFMPLDPCNIPLRYSASLGLSCTESCVELPVTVKRKCPELGLMAAPYLNKCGGFLEAIKLVRSKNIV